eukprot:c27068_g4_i3 orf=24-218(-)
MLLPTEESKIVSTAATDVASTISTLPSLINSLRLFVRQHCMYVSYEIRREIKKDLLFYIFLYFF